MSKTVCTFRPKVGTEVFDQLKKQFGYKIAKEVFYRAAISAKFQDDYKDTLRLTPEGVVTFESLMANKVIQNYIGETKTIEALEKPFDKLDDTIENYGSALESAFMFNSTNEARTTHVATVEYTPDGKIGVKIQRRTQEAVDRFNGQYSSHQLNSRLASIFQPLGVTVGTLTDAETRAGRVGITDFSNARGVAEGFVNLIKVANNMEGAEALTEEFSHLIVGIFRDNPLVDRCVNTLMANQQALEQILGDDYEDVVKFYTDENGNTDFAMVAEEALGGVLRKNLLSSQTEGLPNKSLFSRLFNWIKAQFRRFSAGDVQQAIIDTDSSMSDLAKKILSGAVTISKEDVARAQRNARFNALSDRIERNMEILRKVRDVEIKRDKITHGKSSSLQLTIAGINRHLVDGADTVEGLLNYAYEATTRLKAVRDSLDRAKNDPATKPEELFKILRFCRTFVKSYGVFIDDIANAMNEESTETDNMFDREFRVGTKSFKMRDVISELNMLTREVENDFISVAIPAFTEFLRPFYGESFTIPSGKRAGEVVTVEDLLLEAKNGDISILDRWLDAASDSGDALIQLFDKAIKYYKDQARLDTMKYMREIWALRQEAERAGITTFDWMFERDSNGIKTGNYVSAVNYGKFDEARKALEDRLDEKYGVNPTGEDAKKKIAERTAWRKDNCTEIVGPWEPNPDKFPGEKLTSKQQDILQKFIALKYKFDAKYPDNRVSSYKAIQMRKYGGQRLVDNMKNPGRVFESIRETVSAALTRREDDDAMFGDTDTMRGIVDFEGREHLTLPVLYTTRLRNPEELTDDVFGSLIAYAYAACHYEQMSKCVDPLEVGRIIVSEKRKIPQSSGGKVLKERFKHQGITVTNDSQKQRTNIEDRIDDLFESQIYGRYLKEGGSLSVLGKKISTNKAASWVLKYSSMTQLGLNGLANFANVLTGLAMTNIEAAAQQFFKAKDLAKADSLYAASLVEFVGEIGARTKGSQLALFDELFNVKQNFSEKARHNIQKKSLLQRAFGPSIAFLGQNCGDHWLYNRIAIAMALGTEVYVNGKKMNLWEAVKAATVTDENGFKYVDREKIKDANGQPINISKISRRMAKVNQYCFGVYNEDDANAASRIALGRLCQQYRKWMKIQYSRRFQKGQQNLSLDIWEEGYYRTMARIANELLRGERQMANLTDDEKRNINRAIFEILQTLAVFCLCNLISWPDDKDRPWITKLAEYSCRRLLHELGGLTPSTIMPQEILKTVKSPMPSASWALDIFNVINSALTPSDYVEELQSGPYKGLTRFEKNLIKSPLPYVPWYRQIKKFTGDLDTSIDYYVRPSAY